MNHVPEPHYPQERLEDYQEVLAEVCEYAPLTLEAKYEFAQRLEIAVGWRVADELKKTLEFLNSDEPARSPIQKMSRAERRAALRRRRILVDILLVVALSTLLVSLYALGVGNDALGWFGLAGSLGLAGMAHRTEEGK